MTKLLSALDFTGNFVLGTFKKFLAIVAALAVLVSFTTTVIVYVVFRVIT